MREYVSLARFYDALTRDVPYEKFADFYETLFSKSGRDIKSILDLACGTGSMTRTLAKRGYDMIGADPSPEMLSVAAENLSDLRHKPLLICQSMQTLDLYGTVDAAVCTLDGVNYVKPCDIPEAFRRVNLFLEQGGQFVFDILTSQKLSEMDGGMFVDETEDVFCVWRTEFRNNACFYGVDIFSRTDNKWNRAKEEHIEYAHETDYIKDELKRAGFAEISVFGYLNEKAPAFDDTRVFFSAKKQ